MSFLKNLQAIETEFAPAMDFEAGKGVKIRTIFNALKALEKGEFQTLGEMHKKFGFAPQNATFLAISEMLKSMGTSVSDLSNGKGRQKLSGTDFALKLLEKKGLTLPQKKS